MVSTTNEKRVPGPGLTPPQLDTIGIVERTFSVISLMGCAFIFLSFWCFPSFRKPINRLIIWASVGNVVATFSTLISTSGIAAGAGSALCQTQAFLIQFVLPADSFWSLAMAANVYLTFFHAYDSHDLRKLEKRYACLCYGIPLLVALIYLVLDFVQTDRIYGPAVIWCWVSPKWEWMRVAFFYGPVWVSIAITIGLYAITAREIINRRRELHALSNPQQESTDVEMGPSKSFFKNPFNQANAPIRKITEIEVKSEQLYRNTSNKSATNDSAARSMSSSSGSHGKGSHLEIEIPARVVYNGQFQRADSYANEEPPTPLHKFSTTVTAGRLSVSKPATQRSSIVGPLSPFYPATRVPSVDFPPRPATQGLSGRRQRKETYNRNNAAWSYAKVALLFFVALFIVWVPSTVNRIYSLAHPDKPSYGLSIAAAAVLPTQGFWNAMVYAVTSWTQCKAAVREVRNSKYLKWMCCGCLPSSQSRREAVSNETLDRTLLSPTRQHRSVVHDAYSRSWEDAMDLDLHDNERPLPPIRDEHNATLRPLTSDSHFGQYGLHPAQGKAM